MTLKKEYEMGASGESVLQEGAADLAGSIGQTMNSAAQSIQETLRRSKKSASDAMGAVADGIETSTGYLTDRGMVGVVEDVETLIIRYPFQALLLGLAVGYALSRTHQR